MRHSFLFSLKRLRCSTSCVSSARSFSYNLQSFSSHWRLVWLVCRWWGHTIIILPRNRHQRLLHFTIICHSQYCLAYMANNHYALCNQRASKHLLHPQYFPNSPWRLHHPLVRNLFNFSNMTDTLNGKMNWTWIERVPLVKGKKRKSRAYAVNRVTTFAHLTPRWLVSLRNVQMIELPTSCGVVAFLSTKAKFSFLHIE